MVGPWQPRKTKLPLLELTSLNGCDHPSQRGAGNEAVFRMNTSCLEGSFFLSFLPSLSLSFLPPFSLPLSFFLSLLLSLSFLLPSLPLFSFLPFLLSFLTSLCLSFHGREWGLREVKQSVWGQEPSEADEKKQPNCWNQIHRVKTRHNPLPSCPLTAEPAGVGDERNPSQLWSPRQWLHPAPRSPSTWQTEPHFMVISWKQYKVNYVNKNPRHKFEGSSTDGKWEQINSPYQRL